jgi:hypothetical protein
MSTSPTIEGFRTAFRRPSITCAEIAWRWTVGATTIVLFFFVTIEYLSSLPVAPADAVLLSTRQPALVGRALSHILRGSLQRSMLAVGLALVASAFLWIVASAVGRLATVRFLLDTFPSNQVEEAGLRGWHPIRPLFDLSFLRVAVAFATVVALGGSAGLAGLVSSEANPHAGLATLLFFVMGAACLIAGWSLNWWLSMAAIFAIRDRRDALGAVSAAVTFFRERSGSILAVGLWNGFAHLVAFSIATTAASFPFVFISIAPRLVFAAVIVVTLAYFAVVDWLYIARLAGYIHIAEVGDAPALSRVATTIDRDEPILSDLPNLALGT